MVAFLESFPFPFNTPAGQELWRTLAGIVPVPLHAIRLAEKFDVDPLDIPVPLKSCSVTLTDPAGIRHTVEVVAESLFEAAATGLAALRKDGWTDPIGRAARIDVEVRETVVRHSLTVMQIERWLQGATTSPNERVKEDRLRTLLST